MHAPCELSATVLVMPHRPRSRGWRRIRRSERYFLSHILIPHERSWSRSCTLVIHSGCKYIPYIVWLQWHLRSLHWKFSKRFFALLEFLAAWRRALMIIIGAVLAIAILLFVGTDLLGPFLALIAFLGGCISGQYWQRTSESGRFR